MDGTFGGKLFFSFYLKSISEICWFSLPSDVSFQNGISYISYS